MTQVTISSKYQVVIPKEVRQQVPLHSGQKLAVVVKEGVITLLPDRPLASLRGLLKGVSLGSVREKRDRL
ncbi:MAG: AbrB family transcriptional regulator [Omnitrophica WOR_2 bacterium RIFCSPHIGHO2_02_FULL_68_15]|nr:MAG: AbrB family transcriptional regulator [Omnitrophica WOR_2 bacterium RIFCSPHIGHO2_02_FULL_68_15]